MILAGHQPVYLPGIIVMAKIALADQFMWVGHCDYQRRSWHSHNVIRGISGPLTLTVPVRHDSGPSINETLIVEDGWRERHLRSIKFNYCKRPYFKDYFPELETALLMRPPETLALLNISLAHILCHWLDIQTPIHLSENFGIEGHKTAMLAEMCDKIGANHYLSSPGEEGYVNKAEMNGYAHSYLKFNHPVYEQGARNFMPNLSVIDLVFNCGPQSGDIVRSCANV